MQDLRNARIVKYDPDHCSYCSAARDSGAENKVVLSTYDHPVWLHDERVVASSLFRRS